MKLKVPNPRDYDSDYDYRDACEAYQAYLNGEYHVYQPRHVKQHIARRHPDNPHFIEKNNGRAEI